MSNAPTDLLALARAYMALPGVPRPFSTPGHGAVWVRSEDTGIRWCWDMYGHRWLPDLTDDATGGVMLCALTESCEHWRIGQLGQGWTAATGDGESQECATLAEACARVAVALGRAA